MRVKRSFTLIELLAVIAIIAIPAAEIAFWNGPSGTPKQTTLDYSCASWRECAVCCGSARCPRLPGAGVLEPVKVGVLAQRAEAQRNPGPQ